MLTFITRRLLMMVPVLLGVSFLVFAMMKVVPGDPVEIMLGDYATPERVDEMRAQLRLDDPFIVQFGRFLWNAMQGDLGKSFRGQVPVLDEIMARLPSTVELSIGAFIIVIVLGIPAGLVAARYHNKPTDRVVMFTALTWLSTPNFWLAIMLIIVFGVKLRWISVTGAEGLKNLILPAFCLGLHPAAVVARLMRGSVLETLNSDYVRTARSKGVSESTIMIRHVMRNALIPVVTYLGMLFGNLLTGALFIESVFARPGIGRFAIGAVGARDFPQVQGVVLFTAVFFVIINLFVDVLYGYINPKIRLN